MDADIFKSWYYSQWLYAKDWTLKDYGIDLGDDAKYLELYNEGKEAFLKQLTPNQEDCPYIDLTDYRREWRTAWFHGYRDTCDKWFDDKYKILELRKQIHALVAQHGLMIKYSDEYKDPYIETPEGYMTKIA